MCAFKLKSSLYLTLLFLMDDMGASNDIGTLRKTFSKNNIELGLNDWIFIIVYACVVTIVEIFGNIMLFFVLCSLVWLLCIFMVSKTYNFGIWNLPFVYILVIWYILLCVVFLSWIVMYICGPNLQRWKLEFAICLYIGNLVLLVVISIKLLFTTMFYVGFILWQKVL